MCCEHQISSGNLSHDSAFDRRTLLLNRKISRVPLGQVVIILYYSLCLHDYSGQKIAPDQIKRAALNSKAARVQNLNRTKPLIVRFGGISVRESITMEK